jgi:CubicO group peptidase (beta-lactamase class C family)
LSPSHPRRVAVLVIIVAVVVAGLGMAPGERAGAAGSDDTYAWSVPRSRVAAAVSEIDHIVARVRRRSRVPGIAVAVVVRGRVVVARGYGTTNARHGRRVDADTAFEVASLAKPIGATVVGRAVDRRQVAWTDPIVGRLPAFRLADPYVTAHVTIEDMYAHRSGLPDHAGDLLADLGFDRAAVLDRLRYLPLAPFRAQYAYTNFGIVAAADAVAAAEGTSWDALSRRLLYRPLGMTHTSSRFDDFAAEKNRADPHTWVGRRWVPRAPRDTDVQSAASGVSSSARDLGHWLAMLSAGGSWHGRRLLSPAQMANLQAPRVTTAAPTSPRARPEQYALGFDVGVDATGRVRLSHSGASPLGVGANFALSPATGVGIVVLTNAAPVGAAEAIVAEFMDRALLGHPTHDWYAAYRTVFARLAQPAGSLGATPPGDPQPALPASAYIGTYANDFYGPLRVVQRADGLVMQLGPAPQQFALRHWTGNTFAYRTRGEHASGMQPVTFAVSDGRVTSVTVGNLNTAYGTEAQLGVFRRSA